MRSALLLCVLMAIPACSKSNTEPVAATPNAKPVEGQATPIAAKPAAPATDKAPESAAPAATPAAQASFQTGLVKLGKFGKTNLEIDAQEPLKGDVAGGTIATANFQLAVQEREVDGQDPSAELDTLKTDVTGVGNSKMLISKDLKNGYVAMFKDMDDKLHVDCARGDLGVNLSADVKSRADGDKAIAICKGLRRSL